MKKRWELLLGDAEKSLYSMKKRFYRCELLLGMLKKAIFNEQVDL